MREAINITILYTVLLVLVAWAFTGHKWKKPKH